MVVLTKIHDIGNVNTAILNLKLTQMSPPSSRNAVVCGKHRDVPRVKLHLFPKETKRLVTVFNIFRDYFLMYSKTR